jgi:cytochrome P450
MSSNNPEPLVQGLSLHRSSQRGNSTERPVNSVSSTRQLFGYRITCFFLSHLWPLKLVFAVLRRVRPIATFGKTMVVTKASDVREVLERFDDFTLGDFIKPGMPWGSFMMTVDGRDQHAQERQLLQSVVIPSSDVQRIRAIVAVRCRQQIDAANGQIDVVTQLFEPVVVSIATEYFGVPPLNGSEQEMAHVMRDLAGIIMVNPPVGSEPWARSRDSIANVTTHLLAELSARKSASAGAATAVLPDDDLLTRLVKQLRVAGQPSWFDEDWIRRYLTGLLATGASTIVRAAAHAVDQLLAHPDALKEARTLAEELEQEEEKERRGMKNRVEESQSALRHYIYEALRFRPMLPLLIRDTPRETVIAFGTERSRPVPAGTRVLAPPLAAMFDPEVFSMPWRFQPSWPLKQYLLFGQGARECFGRYIAETALMQMIRSLLLLPDLARAAGSKGRVAYDGPVASALVLTFQKDHSKPGLVGAEKR